MYPAELSQLSGGTTKPFSPWTVISFLFKGDVIFLKTDLVKSEKGFFQLTRPCQP